MHRTLCKMTILPRTPQAALVQRPSTLRPLLQKRQSSFLSLNSSLLADSVARQVLEALHLVSACLCMLPNEHISVIDGHACLLHVLMV